MTDKNQSPNGQVQKNHVQIVEVLRQTAPLAVAELDFVKKKYIDNYNLTHPEKIGELMYHRQLVHLKQIISGSDQLKACDPFSVYACFVTAAVNGDSLDPNDDETYLVPLKGKAYLWPQVKSRVKRLRNSGQVNHIDQAKLVYQGDIFEVENGRVKRHVEKFETEIITAGYVRFILDEKGTDKFFIYRKTDWEAWKSKSPSKALENWSGGTGGQPMAAFLRTKIVKHACNDKGWSSSRVHPAAEQFKIEIEDPDEMDVQASSANDEEQSFSPAEEVSSNATVSHDDEDMGGAF